MTTQPDPISLWNASAVEDDFTATTAPVSETDVAIVGGGFTGLSTALHCAQAGIACQVLEANQIGFGGSGRNAGLINAGTWAPPKELRDKLGEATGGRFVERMGAAPAYVMELIEQHQIRCELTRTGTIHAAHSASGLRDLQARAQQWQQLGAPVDLLTADQTREKTGSAMFHGGLLDHRAGTLNPMGYVRGLARAAYSAGAKISTGVRVTSLRQDGGQWLIGTDDGVIRARHVVLGTNAYTDTLWPGLDQSLMIIHYFQVATKPMTDRLQGILPDRQGVWTTNQIMFSVRRDAFDRLIIGSMGTVIGGPNGLTHRWAARQLRRLFPSLGPVEFEEAWHGKIAMTPDHLPRIHRLAPGLYTPIGYNGRGITTGTIFGRAMAELLAGGNEADLPMPITDVAPAPRRALTGQFYQASFTANQFFRSF